MKLIRFLGYCLCSPNVNIYKDIINNEFERYFSETEGFPVELVNCNNCKELLSKSWRLKK